MPGPLEGVVIVDLSRVVAGPQATMALADLGARVIKVEQPGGDETRGWGPPFAGDDQVSTYYLSVNRNKESITLDLKSDEGRHTLGRLVRHADVLVENFQGTRWTVAREVPESVGNDHPSIAPYGTFRCKDGQIQIGVANQGLWRRFAPIAGLDPDDPRYATIPGRSAHRAELTADIERVLGGDSREAWLARLDEAGVPAGAIRSIDEVYEWEQTRSQGLVVEVDHPRLGTIELPGPPLRFDGSPPREHTPPPLLGEHNEAVLAWLREKDGPDERERGE